MSKIKTPRDLSRQRGVFLVGWSVGEKEGEDRCRKSWGRVFKFGAETLSGVRRIPFSSRAEG